MTRALFKTLTLILCLLFAYGEAASKNSPIKNDKALITSLASNKVYLDHCKHKGTVSLQCLHKIGNALIMSRKSAEAVKLYRLFYALEPNYAPARLNLGLALFQIGDRDSAVYHLEAALAGDLPAAIEQKTHKILSKIRGGKLWQVTSSFHYKPVSNLSSAPDAETITLNNSSFLAPEVEKGVLIDSTLGLSFRPRLNATTKALFNGTLFAQGILGEPDYLSGAVRARIGIESSHNDTLLGFGIMAQQQYINKEAYGHSFGVWANYQGLLRRNLSFGAYGSLARLIRESDHPKLAFRYQGDRNLLDGWDGNIGMNLRWHKSSKLSFEAAIPINFVLRNTDEKSLRFGSYLGFNVDLPHHISLNAKTGLFRNTFPNENVTFGGYRRDWTSDTQIKLTHSRWTIQGMAPYIGYQFTRNRSTLPFYSNRNHSLIFGLTGVY